MRKLTFFKPRPLLGLEIGPTAINLLELSQQRQRFRVESYAKILFTPTTHPTTLTQVQGLAIQEAITEARTRTKWAAVALPPSVVIHKTLPLPGDSVAEATIRKEAAKALPYPPEEINVDFQVTGSAGKQEIVWVATRAQHVYERVEALALGGLIAKIVEPQRYALERVFHWMLGCEAGIAIAVIEVGTPLVLHVVCDCKIRLTRELFFEAGDPCHLLSAVFEKAPVDRILLSGEKPLEILNEWAVSIEKGLSIPTHVADPFINMTMGPHVVRDQLMGQAHSLLVCCGLALRCFYDQP